MKDTENRPTTKSQGISNYGVDLWRISPQVDEEMREKEKDG